MSKKIAVVAPNYEAFYEWAIKSGFHVIDFANKYASRKNGDEAFMAQLHTLEGQELAEIVFLPEFYKSGVSPIDALKRLKLCPPRRSNV